MIKLYKKMEEFCKKLAVYADGSRARNNHFTVKVYEGEGDIVNISIHGLGKVYLRWSESVEEIVKGTESYHESLRGLLSEAGRLGNITEIEAELQCMSKFKVLNIEKE